MAQAGEMVEGARNGEGARAAHAVGLLFAVLGAVGFSFKAVLVKLAYQYSVDAETLLALRMVLALPFFLVMAMVADGRAAQRLGGRDWAWMAALGFSGYYLASYLDFLGLRYISAALERLILFLYPSLVIVLSALWLGKPVARRTVAALGLSYLGIGLAVGHDVSVAGDTQQVLLGCGLVFGSALAYALYLMGNGEVVGRLGAMRVTALASSFACLFCIAQFLLLRPVSALLLTWQVYALGLAMAVFSTVAPVWLVSEAIRRLGAALVVAGVMVMARRSSLLPSRGASHAGTHVAGRLSNGLGHPPRRVAHDATVRRSPDGRHRSGRSSRAR